MFYTLALMLIFAVILLIFDHESRYSQLFVLMSVGAAVAFFFIILQINMFAEATAIILMTVYITGWTGGSSGGSQGRSPFRSLPISEWSMWVSLCIFWP